MRRILTLMICVEVLAACGGLAPVSAPPTVVTRRLRAPTDRVWDAAQDILLERGYEIRRQDRGIGILETDWYPINPDYSAGLFVTAQQDRYSQCAKPGLGQAFQGKEARLTLHVSPSVKRDETAVTVQATFRTRQYLGLPMATGEARALVFCRSTGWLEDELAARIQLHALGVQFDRLRRGGPQ